MSPEPANVPGQVRRPADPDSRARSLLANERTFLAWVRTGLSMVAIGVASAQFIARDEVFGIHLVTVLSVFLAITGVLMTVVAGVQFRRATEQINTGTYRPNVTPIWLTVMVVVIAGIISIGIILILRQPL